MKDRPIVVVGGGPSGLAAAIWAKRAAISAGVDLPVTVFEQRSCKPTAPAHGTKNQWGTRFNSLSLSKTGTHNLASLGINFSDPACAVHWKFSRSEHPSGEILRPVRFTKPDPKRATQDCKRVWIFPQVACIRIGQLEASLLQTAQSLGVDVRWGTKVIALEDAADSTTIFGLKANGEQTRISAWLTVLADGNANAHKRAIKTYSQEENKDKTIVEKLGMPTDSDSPDLGRFIAAPFKYTSGGPGLRAKIAPINGLAMMMSARFDMPQKTTMVQARLPTDCNLSDSEKRAWLAWAARENGIEETTMVEQPVEFTITSTRTRQTVSRNPFRKDGIAGAKLLVGMTRASTPQTHGSGFQSTGLSDAFAIGQLVRRLVGENISERAALAHYETGRNNAARMLARRHGYDTPIFGLRAMREEDFDRLVGEAQSRGYRGEQPCLV